MAAIACLEIFIRWQLKLRFWQSKEAWFYSDRRFTMLYSQLRNCTENQLIHNIFVHISMHFVYSGYMKKTNSSDPTRATQLKWISSSLANAPECMQCQCGPASGVTETAREYSRMYETHTCGGICGYATLDIPLSSSTLVRTVLHLSNRHQYKQL